MAMRTTSCRVVAVGLCLALLARGVAGGERDAGRTVAPEIDELGYGFGIVLRGRAVEIMRFKHWLDEIAAVPKGIDTLWAIAQTGHRLSIEHSHYSVLSSGRTQAPMTRNLTNGVGEDVTIKFNAYIPEQGSHRVLGRGNHLVEFTAVQNLYHELAHAMHKMTGRWPYFRSEEAAIEEENAFRSDLARMRRADYQQRAGINGEAVCPDVGGRPVAWLGQELICAFN